MSFIYKNIFLMRYIQMYYHHIPLIYSISHILIGYISFYYYKFAIIFIFYQLYQYFANMRFFFFNCKKILQGNSWSHTLRKLLEFIFGTVVAAITYYIVSMLTPPIIVCGRHSSSISPFPLDPHPLL
jgi:hypothetical protein